MKNLKLNVLAASIILGSALVTGHAWAGQGDKTKEKPSRQMIKLMAKDGSDVRVMVGKNRDKNTYTFTAKELKNTDKVAAKLSNLDKATSKKVLDLLAQLNKHDAKMIELKDMDIKHGKSESKIFMVRTGNTEGEMHIEIDVEGNGKFHESRLRQFVFADREEGSKGKADGKHERKHKAKHKGMKANTDRDMEGDKKSKPRDIAKALTKMIKKSELTAEQVTELKALLDSKNK
jgi:predicted type IV restriction endonuclease